MTDDLLLYQSWITRGSYFNRMLDCGDLYNQWVQNALEYLPRDVLNEYKERLAIVAMGQKDGCRLTKAFYENREIIILSEHVLPKAHADEGQKQVRYFIFVVLHEIAHAVLKHGSPLYEALSAEDVEAQEREADNLALSWFNSHIEALANPYLPPITFEEIHEEQEKSRAVMQRLYGEA